MTPSDRIKKFIKGYEQCRLKAFLPTLSDVPTIGWGATGPDVHMGVVWTQLQADQRFEQDIAKFAAGVEHLIGGAPTTQGQFDALVSFAYNEGIGRADVPGKGLAPSTLLKLHRAGAYESAAEQFKLWNKQAGHVLDGLTTRRAAEAEIYRGN